MRELDVALVEWPQGREAGGPRVVGRTSDPSLVRHVRERLAAERRRELARLEPPVRPDEPDDEPKAES